MMLLCGCGTIGKILRPTFEKMASSVHEKLVVYDPKMKGCNEKKSLSRKYSVAFLCLPTEKKNNGSCDTSVVGEMCRELYKKCDIIVIKSTIPVGMTEKIKRVLRTDNIVFSPEFTSSTQHKGVQNFVVLGGERKHCDKIARLYEKINSADFEVVYTDSKTAEMSKYMLNCFLATKVTFCNEIASCCKASGIEYDDVRNIFIKDSRINPSHTFVYDDKPYYDSHCFNKDISAFNAQYRSTMLIRMVEAVNLGAKAGSVKVVKK